MNAAAATSPYGGLSDLLRGGWVSIDGPPVARCEAQWAEALGHSAALAWRSALSAYEAIYAEAQIAAGSEVILPATAPLAAALALVQRGATPVITDVDPRCWSVTVGIARAAQTARTRAVLVDQPQPRAVRQRLLDWAHRQQLLLIEDGSRAAGNGLRAGDPGADRTVLTFHRQRAAAGGTLVLLNDGAALQRLSAWRAAAAERGMSNLQAVSALDEVLCRPQQIERRRRLGALYRRQLAAAAALHGIVVPTWDAAGRREVLVQVRATGRLNAARLQQVLAARGIATQSPALLLHRQPLLRRLGLFQAFSAERAEQLNDTLLALPAGLTVSDELARSVVCELARTAAEWGPA